jgi:hypothetical protein
LGSTTIDAPEIPGQIDIDGDEVVVSTDGAPPEEVRIHGSVQLGLFEAGGKAPTSSSFTLTGGKFGLVDGRAFQKGDQVVLQLVAVVETVALRDKRDEKIGVVVACEQQHKARIIDARVLKVE